LLAEAEYQAKNYNAARWQWVVLCDYWLYLYRLKPHHRGRRLIALPANELWQALTLSLPSYMEGILGLGKLDLRQSHYQNPLGVGNFLPSWTDQILSWDLLYSEFDYWPTDLMYLKLNMIDALKGTTLGKPEAGMESLQIAAGFVHNSGGYKDRTGKELSKEIVTAVNNVLIQRRSIWRCGRKWPLSTKRQSGKGWEVVEGGRTFWDWLDKAEDEPELSGAG
jgi:hypothetical protein